MKVLIYKENEKVTKNITLSGVSAELGCEKYTQRVVIPKEGYRICIWYSEDNNGLKRTVQLSDGEKITVRGNFIIFHEEYGAYEDITAEDRADFMLMMEK